MHWIPFLIASFVVAAIQQSLGRVWTFGHVGPDLLAILSMLAALRARTATQAALAAWVLGLLADLTTASGPAGATVIGPMSVGYVVAATGVFRVREMFFAEHPLAQLFLAGAFCAVSHTIWIIAQMLLGPVPLTLPDFVQTMGNMLGIALYTAVVAMVLSLPLRYLGGLLGVPATRALRRHRRRTSL
ncbi:MAG: rod shape-determining protein MreD [Phycisphaerae bacterium]